MSVFPDLTSKSEPMY